MSYTSYDTQDRRHRSDRHRDRDSRRDRPVYREEETVEARTGPRSSHQMDLIRHREDSVEEVERDFAPGDGYVQRRSTRRARSDGRGRYEEDDYYDDRRRSARRGGGKGHRRRDYSSSSSSESPPRNRRRKSLGEQALAALGIGGALGAATGHRSHSQDRARGGSRRRHRSYSSSRSPSEDRSKKIQQAVKAALTAGATEAFRSRNDPGGWGGAKGRRVLTAAIGAGGIDGLTNKDPDKKSTRHTIEAVIGGLAGNRILNGPRDRSRSRSRSRSRVRSRARSRGGEGGGLKGLAAGGLAAAAGKALLDARKRSKSRGRRSYSSSSDSRSPRRSKKRSKSVSDYVSQGMAALGLAEGGKDKHRDDRRDSRRDRHDPYYEDDYRGPPQGRIRGGGGEGGRGIEVGSTSDSSSDEISSSEEERTEKKMRGKEFLTAGLASVATIHAAHSVYKSVDNRKKRSKLVKKGEMSPEESHKLKNKARLQDAAAVGIAALGIKGAVSEWKEMNEKRVELREYSQKCAERHEKRLHKLEERMARNENYRRSAPNLNEQFYESGPQYQDGNPYHTGSVLPPPPIGLQQAQYY